MSAPHARTATMSCVQRSVSNCSSRGSPEYPHLQWEHPTLHFDNSADDDDDDAPVAPPGDAGTARRDGVEMDEEAEEDNRCREAEALLASIQSADKLAVRDGPALPSAEATLTHSASICALEADDNERSRVGCTSNWSEEVPLNNSSQAALLRSWQQQGATEEDDDMESHARSRAMSFSQIGSVCRTESGITPNVVSAEAPPGLLRSPTHAREMTNAYIDAPPHQPMEIAGKSPAHAPAAPVPSHSQRHYNPATAAQPPTPSYVYYLATPQPTPAQPLASRGQSGVTSPTLCTLDGSANPAMVLARPGVDGQSYQALSTEMLAQLHVQQQQQQHVHATSRRNSMQGVIGDRMRRHTDPRYATGDSSGLSSPVSPQVGLPSPTSVALPRAVSDVPPQGSTPTSPFTSQGDLNVTTAVPLTAVSDKMSSFLGNRPRREAESTTHDTNSLLGSRSGAASDTVGLAVPCSAALFSFLNANPAGLTYPGPAPRSGLSITPTHHPGSAPVAFAGTVPPSTEPAELPSLTPSRSNSPALEDSGFAMASLGSSLFHSANNARITSLAAATGAHGLPAVPATANTPTSPVAGKERARRNVYITGLPPSWNTTRLREVCERVGTVLCAKVARDRVTNQSLCYGFVLYETDAAARACIATFNGMRVPLEDFQDDGPDAGCMGGSRILPAGGVSPGLASLPFLFASHAGQPMTALSCRFAHERAAPTFGQSPAPGDAAPRAGTRTGTTTAEGDFTPSLSATSPVPLETTFGSVAFSEVGNASLNHTLYSTTTSGDMNMASATWPGVLTSPTSGMNADGRALGDTSSSLNITWSAVAMPASASAMNPHPVAQFPTGTTMMPCGVTPLHVPAGALTHLGVAGKAPLPQWIPMPTAVNGSLPGWAPVVAPNASSVHTPSFTSRSPTTTMGVSSTVDATNSSAGTSHDGRRNVYITNLPHSWNTTMLRKLCAAFGNILSASVAHHRQTNEPLGYGFVLYESADSAALCIRELDQKVLVVHSGDTQSFAVSHAITAPSSSLQQHVLTCRYAKDTAAPSWLASASSANAANSSSA